MNPEDPDMVLGELMDDMEDLEDELDKLSVNPGVADFYKRNVRQYQLLDRDMDEDLSTTMKPFWGMYAIRPC